MVVLYGQIQLCFGSALFFWLKAGFNFVVHTALSKFHWVCEVYAPIMEGLEIHFSV